MIPISLTPAIAALLSNAGLPTDDLADGSPTTLFARVAGDKVLGVIGLEHHGENGLLRSLCVTPDEQNNGIATQLVRELEAHAFSTGIEALYLLTTTAAEFFSRRGYRDVERSSAPAAIAATAQFAGLCPSTSAFMMKQLHMS